MENSHICTIYIHASREAVWEALTTSDFTSRYFHATNIESTWEPGADITYFNQDGTTAVAGKIIEIDYPGRLSYTWHVHYNPDAYLEKPSRVTFELDEIEDSTRLTLTHDQFEDGSVVLPNISEGWIAILSNLKTLLETGDVMSVS